MSPATVDELITIYLRYGPGTAALRTRAIAQIAAKVLYLNDGSNFIPKTRLAEGTATVVGITIVGDEPLTEALEFLRANGIVEQRGNTYRLTPEGKKQIEADIVAADERIRAILLNHFPRSIDINSLRRWFRLCCSNYFARFGNRLVATVFRVQPPGPVALGAVEGIVLETARRSGLATFAKDLQSGFQHFLTSADPRDLDQLWAMTQAMFAARLVAAEVGAEPILIADIRDSLVLLDTNILLSGALEAHRLAASFAGLFRALSSIGVRHAFLHITKEEYQRIVDYRREITLRALALYPREIVMSASDTFMRTAVGRGCATREDFERFFESIAYPVEALGSDLKITELDNAEIDAVASRGAQDKALGKEIEDIWTSQRPRPKSERVIAHDAALTHVAESLRDSDRKCWILSLDRTMQEVALRRAGMHGLPTWITMDSIVQILAVDAAGPAVQAENFAPLLGAIVEYEVEPMLGAYTTEDLALLGDIEERVAGLSQEKITSLATTVARARIAGKAKNDPELQLEVVRAFQKERTVTEQEIAAMRRDLDELKRAYEEERS